MVPRQKTRSFFGDQQMDETLDSLTTRVELLEAMLTDMAKVRRNRDMDRIRKIFDGYLTDKDFEYIAKEQRKIRQATKAMGHSVDQMLQEAYIKPILNKALPEAEMRLLIGEMADIMQSREDAMLRFIENKLSPMFFVDRRGKSLDYEVYNGYEVRCRSCNEISYREDEVPEPVRDKGFFMRLKGGLLETICLNTKCKNPEDTYYVSSANNYRLKNPVQSAYAQEIGGRVKSGGRLLAKFIDRLAGIGCNTDEAPTICDIYAIRILTAGEKQASKIEKELVELANNPKNNYLISKTEHLNFPRGLPKAKAVHSAIHIDFHVGPERGYREIPTDEKQRVTFEIQIKDQLAHYQETHSIEKIRHDRYVEQQENERRNEWRPFHWLLLEHLTPLFERMDYT